MSHRLEDEGGVIMEISGLGEETPKAVYPMPEIVLPRASGSPEVVLTGGVSLWEDILPVAVPLGMAFLLMVILAGKEDRAPGLGIIKRCRLRDMTPRRPRKQQIWCLWDSKGRRILGRHPTRERALRQERLIQMRKRI